MIVQLLLLNTRLTSLKSIVLHLFVMITIDPYCTSSEKVKSHFTLVLLSHQNGLVPSFSGNFPPVSSTFRAHQNLYLYLARTQRNSLPLSGLSIAVCTLLFLCCFYLRHISIAYSVGYNTYLLQASKT